MVAFGSFAIVLGFFGIFISLLGQHVFTILLTIFFVIALIITTIGEIAASCIILGADGRTALYTVLTIVGVGITFGVILS
jgi:hypothetical protein